MGVLMELLGANEAKAAFERKAKRAPRAVRNAVRRCATIQTKAIKANLKRTRTGLLLKSIGNKVVEGKRGRVTALSGPRKGFKVKITEASARRLRGVRETKKGDKKIVLKNRGDLKVGDVIDATKYAHLVEKGSKQRRQKKTGRNTGTMPAFPFMRPAFEQTKGQVVAEIRAAMQEVAGA